jgi:hypothetical protein
MSDDRNRVPIDQLRRQLLEACEQADTSVHNVMQALIDVLATVIIESAPSTDEAAKMIDTLARTMHTGLRIHTASRQN